MKNLIKLYQAVSRVDCLEKFMPESKIYFHKIYDSIIITYFKQCVNRKYGKSNRFTVVLLYIISYSVCQQYN